MVPKSQRLQNPGQGLVALVSQLNLRADPVRAVPMAAYMRNKFPCLGISAPVRRKVVTDSFPTGAPTCESEVVQIARELFHKDKREFHLAAIDLLVLKRKLMSIDFFNSDAEFFLSTHSWWDSVDALRPLIGFLVRNNPGSERFMFDWIKSENMWLRRSALIHQLNQKTNTDSKRLGELCTIVAGDPEFFVAKAVGWALRDYSVTNPLWVANYVAQHPELTSLARREALKRITRLKQ